ncbi:GNAT family N-acetyltransferase [Arthrobacter sp. NPDC090010]|uniref:GNAT family N-acetyltransferase n=1 Tax=Arthrobacter sp. NPDC090010 TaxID=3363942 RepID=UPI003812B4E8
MILNIRPERSDDFPAVRALVATAFRTAPHAAPAVDSTGDPGEATLVEWLRTDRSYLPDLALVAELDGAVVGHVMTTRSVLEQDATGSAEVPVLGLGPISVRPDHQKLGIGSALIDATIAVAERNREKLIALLGDPGYYGRHGWEPATRHGVASPDPSWGEFFQVRLLAAYDGEVGRFRYAEPFSRLG